MNPNDALPPSLRPSQTLGTKPIEEKEVDPNILDVEIRSPDKTLYKGTATAISSRNEVGPFDVLPQHENFISIISGKITVWITKNEKQEIENTSAIMKAKSNKIRVFLGVEELNQDEVIPVNTGLNRPLPPKQAEEVKK